MKDIYLPLVVCLVLGGCAMGGQPRSHQRSVEVASGETVTVVSVKPVRMPSTSLPVIVLGAAIGSLVGPKALDVDTGIGTVAGAAGGGLAASYLFSVDGLEIVVRKNSGETVAVTQTRGGRNPMIGEVVQLVSTDTGPRICTSVRDCP